MNARKHHLLRRRWLPITGLTAALALVFVVAADRGPATGATEPSVDDTRMAPISAGPSAPAKSKGGALDVSFAGDGMIKTIVGPIPPVPEIDSEATAVVVQPDGKIVAAGKDVSPAYALARFNADGSPDLSFGTNGEVSDTIGALARAMALQPDGKIVLAGTN